MKCDEFYAKEFEGIAKKITGCPQTIHSLHAQTTRLCGCVVLQKNSSNGISERYHILNTGMKGSDCFICHLTNFGKGVMSLYFISSFFNDDKRLKRNNLGTRMHIGRPNCAVYAKGEGGFILSCTTKKYVGELS
ncbi:hypothetical protein EGR_07675 [Echinococcus granulosus]|uniref:Uncharacterized protein n=1 Tax=Echinococcus granulosus TaxID=6210 RepID=W6U8B2_ECHGR|nr:hypothetical protein EGR_07675 [Echinococcus granulosus]EUB57433.1 hypothetical protein EGR_07675 [Echinococcus granulosus]